MKFGLFIPQGWRMDLVGIDPDQHWGVMAGLAHRADENELWSSIWVYDHFHTVPVPSDEATHEAWTLMAAFAAATGRVRLGQMCTCIAYRNPAYLAKVAATVDIISEGRLEMGIGAGWYEQEWRAYGYGFPSAGDRLGALREGVEIFRQMWTQGQATLDGRFYQVDGAICAPRPLQGTSLDGSPISGIPLWVAGGGERKTLRIAAEYAQYTNFDGTPEVFEHKSAVLRGHCDAVGRDFATITRSADYNVCIGGDQRELDDRFAWMLDHFIRAGVPRERAERQVAGLRREPLVGTPEQIVEKLRALEKLGMTYAIVYFPEAAYDTCGLEVFEQTVLPELAPHGEHHRRAWW